jgi:glycogen synthase
MKVAMLGWEFPPFMAGGLGVHCLHLTRGLASLGVQVDFYMPSVEGRDGPLGIAKRYDHLNIIEVPADPGLEPYGRIMETYDGDFNRSVMKYNARLVDSFATTNADLIHCHDWITVPAALELKERTGLPLVFTVHSTEYDRSAGFYPQQWIEDLERAAVHAADAVIAVSRYTKGLLEKRYGAHADRVVAIHNGIDPEPFQRDGERDYTTPRGTVLFLSRLCRQKGLLYFLDAARQVLAVRPQTGFVVAGKGDMLETCIRYTLDHGISDRVRFVGFVPDAELPAMYRDHEVYVLPSISEPFGITALEAMATGMPTIVTRASGIAEAAEHALKVNGDDPESLAEMILHVLESPDLRQVLGSNARQEVRRFAWETCARRTIETYQHVNRVKP